MDEMTRLQLHRLHTSIDQIGAQGRRDDHVKTVGEIVRAFGLTRNRDPIAAFEASTIDVLKSVAATGTADAVFNNRNIQAAFAAAIASTSEQDGLSAIQQWAMDLPRTGGPALFATGAVGDLIAEGRPKIVRRVGFAVGQDDHAVKSVSVTVCTDEYLRSDRALRFTVNELLMSVTRATNRGIVALLQSSNLSTIAAGADPLASLRAGLRAAGPSVGYVVFAPAGDVQWLATHEANRGGMGVRGGQFVPGVTVVALDDATAMTVVPASRLALFDGGIELRSSTEGVVDLADSPSSPATTPVSLFQSNSSGILAERLWRLTGAVDGVVSVTGA